MSARSKFLKWQAEHGGYGCEESAFFAGLSANEQLLNELKTILDSLIMFGIAKERHRIFEIIELLK